MIVSVIVGLAVGILFIFALSMAIEQATPVEGERTITGQVVCLPHKQGLFSGVATSECKIGFFDVYGGKYYGLILDAEHQWLYLTESSDEQFVVTGTVRKPVEPDNIGQYGVAGVIIVDNVTEKAEIIDIHSVDSCQMRSYFPTSQQSSFRSSPAIATSSVVIAEIDGFPACVQMYGSQGIASSHPKMYNFVLKPNSTGHITLLYDFGIYGGPDPELFTELSRSSTMYLVNGSSLVHVPANQTSLTVSVDPEDVTIVSPTVLKVTYVIETKNTRLEEIGNTYLVNIYQVYPGQLITIGDSPHVGRLPWD